MESHTYPNVAAEVIAASRVVLDLIELQGRADKQIHVEINAIGGAQSRLRNALRALEAHKIALLSEMEDDKQRALSLACDIHEVSGANIYWCKTHGKMWGAGAMNADEPCGDWVLPMPEIKVVRDANQD